MKNRKILKFIISISILILFIFEQIAYCMPNYTYEFTLRVPMHYGREHVRKDRTKEIREAIEDSDTVKLAEEIKIADSSALDYTIFISTVLRLIEKDTAFLEIVKAKMGKLKGHKSREICSLAGELENFLSDSLRLYKAIGYSNEEVFVYDSTAILADSVSVGRRGVGFDKSTAAFYAGKMLTSNKEFILNTIRSMAKNSNIDADDIEYPLVAAKCQAGRFQDVYIAFAILKDSRLIPFAFSIARSAEASKIVEEEYNNFARNKGDEDVIQVCEVSSIDTLDGKVSAYTSRFENDSSEFQYTIVSLALGVQRAQGAIGLISNSRLKTKTILPPSYKKILRDSRKGIKELPDYSKALAGAISIFTKFYDPEARTMIKDFSLLAGDVNLPDSEIGEGDASRSAKLSRPLSELSFRLFAWRGNRQDVYSWHFLNYLFGLSYLSEDERDIVLKNEFGLAIIAGILEGLKYGLIKKYGIDKGIEKTKVFWAKPR